MSTHEQRHDADRATENESSDELLPEGAYRARAIDAMFSHSKHKQTPQVRVEYVIVEGDHEGEHVADYFSLSPKAVDRTISALRASGYKLEDDADIEAILGCSGRGSHDTRIVLGHEVYNGEARVRIKNVARYAELDPSVVERIREALARSKEMDG